MDTLASLIQVLYLSHSMASGQGIFFRALTYFKKSKNFIYLIGVFDGLSIMTSFFAEFDHTENGVECSDVDGLMHLSTAQECADAVSYAKSFNSLARYDREFSSSAHPNGCIIVERTIPRGIMWFNSHPTGGGDRSQFNIICKTGNT